MELLVTLASGITPHAPVIPTITAANAIAVAILSAVGHLTGLSHANEALNTGYVAPLGHLATSGSLSGNTTAQFHHAADPPVVLMVLMALCFIDGFFPPLSSESIIIGLTSWFIASPPGAMVPLRAVFLTAGVGAMPGDSFAFFLGMCIPMEKISFLNRGKGKTAYDLARHTPHRRSTSLIFAARFVPGGRTAVNICAGTTNLGYARFLRTNFMAATCWVAYGMTISTVSEKIVGGVHPLLAVTVGITGGLVLGPVVNRLVSQV